MGPQPGWAPFICTHDSRYKYPYAQKNSGYVIVFFFKAVTFTSIVRLRLCCMLNHKFTFLSSSTSLFEKIILSNKSQCNRKEKKSKSIKFHFVSSKFKWFWLVAGNRYFQCDGLEMAGVLDEVRGLTIRIGVVGTV